MLNYNELKRQINEKGTEEIKYKLYNSDIKTKELYEMYKNAYDITLRDQKINKKRAKLCYMIVDIIYKHGLYYKETNQKVQLQKIHEDILKRDKYLKAKGLDRFEILFKKE